MTKEISPGRQLLYYGGMALAGVGLLMFLSVLVGGFRHAGGFPNVAGHGPPNMGLALGGMALVAIGGLLRAIGARGVAGSGIVLDPRQARDDLEPYARMTGGMFKDAMDEADINLGGGGDREPEKVIMVKCLACGRLNDENAKFCQECGRKI